MKTSDYSAYNSDFFLILKNPPKDIKIIPKPITSGVQKYTVTYKLVKNKKISVPDNIGFPQRVLKVSDNPQKDIRIRIIPINNPKINNIPVGFFGIDFISIGVDFIPICCSMLIGCSIIGCFSVSVILSPIIDNNCLILTLWGGYQ